MARRQVQERHHALLIHEINKDLNISFNKVFILFQDAIADFEKVEKDCAMEGLVLYPSYAKWRQSFSGPENVIRLKYLLAMLNNYFDWDHRNPPNMGIGPQIFKEMRLALQID